MKISLRRIIAGIAVLSVGSMTAHAVSLSLLPVAQTINQGGAASVQIVITDIGDMVSPSIGGFDLDLSYDPAVLSAGPITFGSFLDLGTLGSLRSSDLSVPGAIHLDEVSFETSMNLNDLQPDPLVLATLGFTGLAPGTSAIGFSFAALSEEEGQTIVDFTTAGASIEVIRVTGVPDSGSMMTLFLAGIAGLAGFRRFQKEACGVQSV